MIGVGASAGGDRTWSTTNTIEIDLEPPTPTVKFGPRAQVESIESEVVQAIQDIHAAVAAGRVGESKFSLHGATLSLSFGVSTEGAISLIAEGDDDQDAQAEVRYAIGNTTRKFAD